MQNALKLKLKRCVSTHRKNKKQNYNLENLSLNQFSKDLTVAEISYNDKFFGTELDWGLITCRPKLMSWTIAQVQLLKCFYFPRWEVFFLSKIFQLTYLLKISHTLKFPTLREDLLVFRYSQALQIASPKLNAKKILFGFCLFYSLFCIASIAKLSIPYTLKHVLLFTSKYIFQRLGI